MAIKINVYQDKRRNSNHLFYGRALHPTTVDTAGLAQRIQANVSVKESDVYAVLIELAEVMAYELSVGNKVQLDRFGYFAYGAKTSGAITAKDWTVPENLKGFRINFQLFNRRNSTGKVTSKSLGGLELKGEKYAIEGQIITPKKEDEEDDGE